MPTGLWLDAYVGLWTLVLAEGLAVVALLRQVGLLQEYWVQRNPDMGLPIGSSAPALPQADLDGRPVPAFADSDREAILFFLARGCSGCKEAMKLIPELAQRGDADISLIISAREPQARDYLNMHLTDGAPANVRGISDPERGLQQEYRVEAVPYGVVVGPDGVVWGKGIVASVGQVEKLVRDARKEAAERQAPAAGGPSLKAAAGGGAPGD